MSASVSAADFQDLVRHLTMSISDMDSLLRQAGEKEIMLTEEM